MSMVVCIHLAGLASNLLDFLQVAQSSSEWWLLSSLLSTFAEMPLDLGRGRGQGTSQSCKACSALMA